MAEPQPPREPPPIRHEILLIDPDAVRRRDLAEALERHGFRVLPAGDPEVASAVVRTRRVGAVVARGSASAWRDPRWLWAAGTPHETLGSSRRNGSPGQPTPLIRVVSGRRGSAARWTEPDGEPAGQDLVARLSEPVGPEQLAQVIRSSLARRRQSQTCAGASQTCAALPDASPDLSRPSSPVDTDERPDDATSN